MANQTELDELDLLTNPELVKKAEQEGSRSKNRPKFLDITCDIANDELRPYVKTTEYGESNCINLRLQNIVCHRAVAGEIFTDDEYNLEIRLPKKANSNAEPALMVAAAMKVDSKLNTIRVFPGLKKVHLVERVHVWKMREKVQDEFGEDMRDEKGNLVYADRPVPTYYYAVVDVGGKGTIKAPEPRVEVTDEAKAVAKTIIESEEDGMTESAFIKVAMKNPVLKDMTDILMPPGNLLIEMIADGTVIRDGEKLRVVV